jgi:hypothetical protein
VAQLDDPQIEISGQRRRAQAFRLPRPPQPQGGDGAARLLRRLRRAAGVRRALEIGPSSPIVFLLIALPLGYASMLFWFATSNCSSIATASSGNGAGWGWPGSRTIASQDVAEIKKKVTSEVNGTPYHTLMAVVGGKDVSLISNLRTRDADHVIEEITGALRGSR